MALLRQAQRLALDQVTRDKVFKGTLLPELGLIPNRAFPFRVYVLECESFFDSGSPSYYVGIVSADGVLTRLEAHFGKRGAAYTGEHPPKGIVFLFPAATWAVESFVYHALMTVLPSAAFTSGRVGGWTQTAPKSSFQRFKHTLEPQLEREWRMANNLCLDCGYSCAAGRCTNRPTVAMRGSSVTASSSMPSPPPSIKPVARPIVPAVPSSIMTDDVLFDKWYDRWSLSSVEQRGWVPMSKVLPVLGEAQTILADS